MATNRKCQTTGCVMEIHGSLSALNTLSESNLEDIPSYIVTVVAKWKFSGLIPMMCWLFPMTCLSPAIRMAQSIGCGCGKQLLPMNLIWKILMQVLIRKRSPPKMPLKISAWCYIQTMPVKMAKNSVCANSISWPQPVCRIFWITGLIPMMATLKTLLIKTSFN